MLTSLTMNFRIDCYEDVFADCRDQRLRAKAMRSVAGHSRAVAEGMMKSAAQMMATALRAHGSTSELLGQSDDADLAAAEDMLIRLQCEHALALHRSDLHVGVEPVA